MTSRTVFAATAAVAFACAVDAQIQPVAPVDGQLLPIATYTERQIHVLKDGKKRRAPTMKFELHPSTTFTEGLITVSDISPDLDPLRNATPAERAKPDAIHFRYTAKVSSDRPLSDCYALLTFSNEGSVGTHLIPIGKLKPGALKTVEVEIPAQVEVVGSLHVFCNGHEVRSNLHPSAYDPQAYFAELTKSGRGLPAAELLNYEDVFPHVLSRDGQRLASIRKRDGKKIMFVYDLASMKLLYQEAVAQISQYVSSPVWVSDHELAYVMDDSTTEDYGTWRLKLLDVATGKTESLLDDVIDIIESLPSRPDELVLESYTYRSGSWWEHYNVHTRKSSKIDEPSAGSYFFDREGTPRLMVRIDGDERVYEFKPTPTSRWRDLDDLIKQPGLKFNEKGANLLDRVADIHSVGPDGDTLYISTRLGSDLFELAAFSMSKGVIVKTIAKHQKYDLSTSDSGMTRLLFAKETPQLIGLVFEGQKPQVVWVDPGFAMLQKSIDRALPDKVNLPLDWTADGSAFVYFSFSDQDPGTYYVFRPLEGKIIPVLKQGERLEGRTMAKTTPIQFAARDRSMIPAYVTRPPEMKGPAPLVVLVHGGPMSRDSWGFSPLNQFLASRGYIVLQVNYRGSSGYGAAFQKAGLRARLDTVVLDDIADGARHLIAQGEADPNRVALVGASFGGWATYMGLIKYPELYRAGVAISAVSNWRMTLREDRRSGYKLSYSFWRSILNGPRFAEDEKFIEPTMRAAELKQPIYIMHGEQDGIVSSKEAKLMLDALRKTNSHVYSRSFPRASHSEWSYDDRVVQFNEIAAFLSQHLAPTANAAATPPATKPSGEPAGGNSTGTPATAH
ncbi:hypothetical protein DB347_24365 [Opitutaceae bacterium EW11]|nr:hypothetical protein DB347_24365 [Opitutaceae bacterium EW11]